MYLFVLTVLLLALTLLSTISPSVWQGLGLLLVVVLLALDSHRHPPVQ